MRIQWTEIARKDLNYIEAYISEENPLAALKTIVKIIDSVESNLSQHPGIGRPGKYPRTRELVIAGTPYIVPYQITGERISIIRVLHGAMKWQDKY